MLYLLYAFLVIVFAYTVRSLTGLGGALITISFLSLVYPLKFVVGVDVILEIFLCTILIKQIYKNFDFKDAKYLILGSLIGVFIGSVFLVSFNESLLRHILGVFIIFSSLILFINLHHQKIQIPTFLAVFIGLVSGSFGTVTGSSAPPLALYLSNKVNKKIVLKSTILGLVFITAIFRFISYTISGVLDFETYLFVMFLLPGVLIGIYFAKLIEGKVNVFVFKKIVLALIFITGVSMVVF